MPAPSEPIGTRDMLSTPPPTTSCCVPDMTPMAAKLTACRPEPQKRLSVTPVTSTGQPAASTALRAMLAPCSPAWETQPIDDVVDVAGVDAGALRRGGSSVCASSSCGMDAAERALAGLAAAARRAGGVENIGFGHGRAPFSFAATALSPSL